MSLAPITTSVASRPLPAAPPPRTPRLAERPRGARPAGRAPPAAASRREARVCPARSSHTEDRVRRCSSTSVTRACTWPSAAGVSWRCSSCTAARASTTRCSAPTSTRSAIAAGCCSSTSAVPGARSRRRPQTWALAHHAADVEAMAGALGLERYAVLGHSYGAFIALQHAVDFPGSPAATIVSSGIPDARFLAHVQERARRLRARRAARAGPVVVGARGRGAHAGGRRRAALRPAARSTSPTRATRASTTARRHGRRGLRTRRAARGGDGGLRRDRGRGPPCATSRIRCSCSPAATTARARCPPPRRWPPACPTPSSSSSSTAAT